MSTYLSNGDSFKIIADAIREKGKTTELLEFPNGMAEAILNIHSGSGSIFISPAAEICSIFISQASEICSITVSTYYKEDS